MAGVYWVGQDGNTYMKGDGIDGVQKWFAPLQSPQQMGFSQIDDPVHPTGKVFGATTPPPSTTDTPVFNRAAAENTQRAIDEIPGLLNAALEAERQKYRNAISGFDAQEAQQRKTYDESTVTNQKNYDSNFMESIRAGIKGLGGHLS